MDLERIIERTAELLGVPVEEFQQGARHLKAVEARSLVSYWAVRELGLPGTEVARRLGVTQPAVSQAVRRGARIAEEKHFELKETQQLIFLWPSHSLAVPLADRMVYRKSLKINEFTGK
jgi:putative transposase